MSVKRVIVPNLFAWLLLIQAPIAAIAIYASVFVLGGKSVPFVLAVVATSLHLLLGVYCYLTRSKLGSYHYFMILPWLAVCAGLWCCPLSYFARHVSLAADGTDWHQVSTWTRAGCAVSALSIFVDIALMGFFLLGGRRQDTQESQKGSFTSSPLEDPPQLPPLSPLQHHRISFPYRPATATAPNRNPHLSPTIIPVSPEPQAQRQPQQHPPSQRQQQQQPPPLQQPRHHHHHHHLHRKPSKPLPPLPTPHPFILPPFSPTTTPTNRILLILHLTHLQHLPAGNFPPSRELTALLQAWAGPRSALTLQGGGGAERRGGGHGATALAHACLTELCGRVWAAQREGREEEVLSGEELAVLEGVGWDLGWVLGRIERARGWLVREGCEGGL